MDKLFGFIVNDGIVALMSNDAMIDYHQGKITTCEFATLKEFVERDGCNCTILENAPIAK